MNQHLLTGLLLLLHGDIDIFFQNLDGRRPLDRLDQIDKTC